MTDRTHALLAPSSAERWLRCAGSVVLSEGITDEGSQFADEGSVAHQVGQWSLDEGQPAAAYVGRTVCLRFGGKEHEVTEEMAGYVQAYVDRVREYAGDGTLMVEQRLPIAQVTGEADAHGTGDAVILRGDELIVCDLKYGRGVRVDACENDQLRLYALGALHLFGALGDFKRVRLVVLQPRLDHVSEWDCSVDELLAFGRQAADAAELTRLAKKFEANWNRPDQAASAAYLVPGDKQCRWCRAKATCPALARQVQETVGADFQDLTAAEPKGKAASLVPQDATLLAAALSAADLVEDWVRAVRAEVERRLVQGVEVPGYKLVQGKRGARAWTDDKAVETMLRERFRLTIEEAYTLKLISPAQAEKLLKGQPKRWAALQELVTQSEGKPSVAPVTDPRPALATTPTADDFADVSQPAIA